MELQRKSAGLVSLASPTIFCFKVTSPDFHRTWTGQAAEFCQVQRIPLEVRRTVRWVRWNWLGPVKVRWNPLEKRGECKVHEHLTVVHWESLKKTGGHVIDLCHVSYFNTLRETRPSGPRDIKGFFLQITGDPSLDAGCNCNIKFPIRFDMHVQDMRRYIDG